MLIRQFDYSVEGAIPQLMRRYRSEFVFARHLDIEVDLPGVSSIDDQAVRRAVFSDVVHSNEEPPNLFDGLLSRRKADASDRFVGQFDQPLDRQAEMGAALVVCDRVKLVHDERSRPRKSTSTTLGSQQDIERLWSCDEHMRRLLCHLLPLALRGVPSSHRHANVR